MEGHLAGVQAEIAKVKLQIVAVGAEIAKVGSKLEAIVGQLEFLDSTLKQKFEGHLSSEIPTLTAILRAILLPISWWLR